MSCTELSENEKSLIQDNLVEFFLKGVRTPVFRSPKEYGLEYDDIYFPSIDGVSLEGWYIPCQGSNKLVICNHFMPGNRYGYPGHLPQYNNFGGFEVNFLPQYKNLHDAGYNILCYDMRNHGRSADANGRTIEVGLLEYRDVLASIKYANSRPDTKDMEKGLLSICLGCNSTIIGMDKHPEYFKDIKCMVGLQPITIRPFIEKALEAMSIDVNTGCDFFSEKLHEGNGYILDDFQVVPYASSVNIPTKIVQVLEDFRTKPDDVQSIYDHLGTKEKELYWIEGTKERFEGYNYFGKNPEVMIKWFDKYI